MACLTTVVSVWSLSLELLRAGIPTFFPCGLTLPAMQSFQDVAESFQIHKQDEIQKHGHYRLNLSLTLKIMQHQ